VRISLSSGRRARADGLAPRRLYADDDVAEYLRGPLGSPAQALFGIRVRKRRERLTFAHGEREHVGGAIAMAKDAVELPDLPIVGQGDRELGVRQVEASEHALRPTSDART
jgi:hypothetical protein